MARAKKSKADVSQEEMGKLVFPHLCLGLADLCRGLSDVEAGLRRSYGELQGRGRLVMWFLCVSVPFATITVVLASCVSPSYASYPCQSPIARGVSLNV
jgi:hypothetical protein